MRSYKSGSFNAPAYRTIAYAGDTNLPKGFDRTELRDELDATAATLLRSRFESLGYQVAGVDEADLLLYAGVGKRNGREASNLDHADEIVEGTLVLDLFERRTGRHVWQGLARTFVSQSEPMTREEFTLILEKMMAAFPRAAQRQSM